MLHTRSYYAKKILKSYRIARKQYPPAVSRWHAYFRWCGGAVTNLHLSNIRIRYNKRYWQK